MIATKDLAHLRRGQYDRDRQTACLGAHLPAPPLRSIKRKKEQAGFTRSYGFAGLLEAGNCETGPAGETDPVHATLH
jgi:hypothetical protein